MSCLWHNPGVSLAQLGLEHTDVIAAFLETSWRSQFGSGTYPVFSRRYLDWVYGGPHAGDNVLLGYETGGRLVGFRAMLFRPVTVHGTIARAHISTHLAVDPGLARSERRDAVAALGEVYSYVHPSADSDAGTNGHLDTLVSFFDEANEFRRYQQDAETRLASAGVPRVKLTIQPALVLDWRVRACLARHADSVPDIGMASPDDADALAALFAAWGHGRDVSVTMSPDWVRHHLFGFEDSRVYVSRRDGALDGCVSCYALDTVAGDNVRRVVVIEYLLASSAAVAAAVIAETLGFADGQGARGVVMENTTYLGAELCSDVGLMPSARRIVAAVACRSVPVRTLATLLLDVK